MMLWLIGALLYGRMLRSQYPEIRLDGAALYGENDEQLKDLEWQGEQLHSLSADPWITCSLEVAVPIKVIELDQSHVAANDYRGEIIDTAIWQCYSYTVQDGRTLVWLDPGRTIQDLRFDVVDSYDACISVDAIIINSAYAIGLFAAWRVGLLILFLWGTVYCALNACRLCRETTHPYQTVLIWVPVLLTFIIGGIVQAGLFQSVTRMSLVQIPLTAITGLLLVLWTMRGPRSTQLRYCITVILFLTLYVCILEVLSGTEFNLLDIGSAVANLFLLSILVAAIYLIAGDLRWSMAAASVIIGLLGIVDHYYYTYRGTPIELIDCLLAGTAADVVGSYSLAPDLQVWLYLAVEVTLLCCLLRMPNDHKRSIRRMAVAGIYCAAGICWMYGYTPDVSYWDSVGTTQELGYLCSFYAYARRDLVIDKPDAYSRSAAIEILDRYDSETVDTADDIDIIVVMDETLSDLPSTYAFETDTDVMPFLHSLQENTVKGNLLVSVLGGGTADTEWEFLTGCSMAFSGGGGVPYVQYVQRDEESLASELLDLGYQTTAFHPYTRTNYNRDAVYPHLGFEQYWALDDDLVSKEQLRWCVSDAADVIDLIDIYDRNAQSDHRPQFLFNVTMQNHGGYSITESEIETTVRATAGDLQTVQLEEYLSLVRASDQALEELITHYQESDRKTIILIYGDHQPSLDGEITEAMEAHLIASGADTANGQERFMTPFIIWANYDIDEAEDLLISPGYLRAFLLETAGLPLGSWDQFLLECHESYPAINSMGYYDADRQWYSWDDLTAADALLQEYKVLQYGKVFDKGMSVAEY